MEAILHPVLDDIRDFFVSTNFDDTEIIEEFKLPENHNFDEFMGNIEWERISSRNTFKWGEKSSFEIINRMKKSILSEYEYVYFQIGYGEPIFKTSTEILIDNWEEVLHASVQGFPLITLGGEFYLEILFNPKVIYSNFKI